MSEERVEVRFYAELRELLPRRYRDGRISHVRIETQTIKDLVESYGVPHTEVEVILAGDTSVDWDHRPRSGERISVYPVFEAFDVRPLLRLRPEPLRRTRFVLDGHLGTLARRLRLLGFDSSYQRDRGDDELIRVSVGQRRILLTRDRPLLCRKAVTHGYLVRSDQPREQVLEVIRRFQLGSSIQPFTRCPVCNTRLLRVAKADIEHRLPAGTRRTYDDFHTCPGCGRDYWRGAHHQRLARLVAQARAADDLNPRAATPGSGPTP